ncbi:MAG: hypothetical protein OEZ22_10025 [Spirochaetia bacterium]|nr:hypothetical protein [Spirochaetia bacterium]
MKQNNTTENNYFNRRILKNWKYVAVVGIIANLFGLVEEYFIFSSNFRTPLTLRTVNILLLIFVIVVTNNFSVLIVKNRVLFQVILVLSNAISTSYLQIIAADPELAYHFGIMQLLIGSMFFVTKTFKEIFLAFFIIIFIYWLSLVSDGKISDSEHYIFTGIIACGIIFIIVSISNISNIKTICEQYDELKAAKESKENFFASVNHELKTPLFAMGLNLQLLEKNIKDKKSREHLQTINSNMNLLKKYVHNLLDSELALKNTEGSSNIKSISILKLIENSLSNLSRPVKINYNNSANKLKNIIVEFDIEKFSNQILGNIFFNVYKYAAEKQVEIDYCDINKNYFVLTFLNKILLNAKRKESHGLGLNIIRSACKELELKCMYGIDNKNNTFSVNLMIPVEKIKLLEKNTVRI